MKRPIYPKKVQQFIGVANYFHNMCPKRLHTLAILPKITANKTKFQWTKIKQDYFNKIMWIMARDNLLTYPDFNETFKIHTDASAFQLGAVVSQKGKPIAFYSIKLNDTQIGHVATEKELLSIFKTLK